MKKKTNILHVILLALAVIIITACGGEPKPAPPAEESKPKARVPIPKFNMDSAYAQVKRQVEFGPRVPGSKEHKACAKWLGDKLESYGVKVYRQAFTATTYDGVKMESVNIIGAINPQHKKRILLGAHWDSRRYGDYDEDESLHKKPILGADDGASGVGVLMEIARLLQANEIDLGVDIIFFDAEDQGMKQGGQGTENSWCLGAQHWARNPHVKGYKAAFGILLDMVGSKNPRYPKEGYSMAYAPSLTNKVWGLAQGMGYGNSFVNDRGGAITDDHKFVNEIAGIKMIDIINRPKGSETGFGHYWHTHDDNMDVISKRSLRTAGQVVLSVLYNTSMGRF